MATKHTTPELTITMIRDFAASATGEWLTVANCALRGCHTSRCEIAHKIGARFVRP